MPITHIVYLSLLFTLSSCNSDHRDKQENLKGTVPREGTAVILTGAAARIPQEAALLEELSRRGLLKDVVFISGVSSGALNAVVLNGILDGKMTWSDYKHLLFNLQNGDIFFQSDHELPVNTSPARNLFKDIFEERLGYQRIGQLPFTTSISFTHIGGPLLNHKVYRMCSRKINAESDTSLSLVDIVMASTAFPLVFPAAKISNVNTIPDEEYIDGGVGEDHVPYHALLEFEEFRGKGVKRVYIVSRKSDSIPEVSEELKGLGIDDKGLFDKIGVSMDAVLSKGIQKRLRAFAEEAPELRDRTFVYIPAFKENFLMFNFEELKRQYELTREWARVNDPVPLKNFLGG